MTSVEIKWIAGSHSRSRNLRSSHFYIKGVGSFEARHIPHQQVLIFKLGTHDGDLFIPEPLARLSEGAQPYYLGTDISGKRWELIHTARRKKSQ